MQAKTYVGQDETRKPQVARFLRPAALLRVEGVVLLVLSVLLYRVKGGGWLMFGVLLLAPDLSMLGYLAGPQVGAAIYNTFHTYAMPAVVGALGMIFASPLMVAVALIWFAHISMDRTVGYGLKYPTSFKDTHLERVR
ncbi:MAG TPA: DUF4260 domain-containing protein [Rubrobacter sp.]|nr:DUF4260 domain-containing protein [Rubrobacter sp.]